MKLWPRPPLPSRPARPTERWQRKVWTINILLETELRGQPTGSAGVPLLTFPNEGVSEIRMPTTINKQKVLTQLFAQHKKNYATEPEPRPVLEQFIYGVCREGTTREHADRAFRALRDRFFDWNEVRVSSARE